MINDKPTKLTKIDLDKKILRELKRKAAENKKTVSELINEIAAEWLKSSDNNTYTNTYSPVKKDRHIKP